MMSLRNGTAVAIILSIAFVLVAVATRDSLPGFASDTGTTVSTPVDQQSQAQQPADTVVDGQTGQTASLGLDPAMSEPAYASESDSYAYYDDDDDWDDDDYDDDDDDDDDDHHDDDHHDRHHEDDDDD